MKNYVTYMSVYHGDLHKRKRTGGKRHPYRSKRKFEMGRLPTNTLLGERVIKKVRVRGGNYKIRIVSDRWVNVSDGKGGVVRAEILRVEDNPASIHLKRQGIITKGSIVVTNIGRVRITSRPGQNGVLNGILLEPSKS